MSILVFGHKNPDTDSVCAAIALADLKKKLGEDIAPAIQGKLNPESSFVLEKFGVAGPEVVTSYAGKDVYLVDHSDLAQSPDDLGDANILGIVDHHKLGDVTTGQPLECWIWPVGCSCTVVASMYNYFDIEIPKDIAALKQEKGHHSVFLMLTDIMKEGTELLIASDDDSVVEKAFGVAPAGGKAWLPGIMSRKKQIIPFLEKTLG